MHLDEDSRQPDGGIDDDGSLSDTTQETRNKPETVRTRSPTPSLGESIHEQWEAHQDSPNQGNM